MKKKELTTMLTTMIQEALQGFFEKRSHLQKYRRSRLHPAAIEKRAKEKFFIQHDPDDIPSVFKSRANPTTSPEAAYEIPEPIKDLLNGTLRTLPNDPVAVKILQGVPVGKKEAINLAKSMITLPHFPLKQPRKLMNLLVLLAVENQKH